MRERERWRKQDEVGEYSRIKGRNMCKICLMFNEMQGKKTKTKENNCARDIHVLGVWGSEESVYIYVSVKRAHG